LTRRFHQIQDPARVENLRASGGDHGVVHPHPDLACAEAESTLTDPAYNMNYQISMNDERRWDKCARKVDNGKTSRIGPKW
jgi:hypothetical protein